jgi:flagellar biosynthesis/type III secretory pathway chaperone
MANARLDRIASLGLTANRDGVEAWAKTTGVAAVDIWRSLLEVASEAHHTNRINGTLIQTNLQHNQQALAVLLAVASKSNLYGPDGQPKNEIRGNNASRGIIGRA